MEASSSARQCRLLSVPIETTDQFVNGFRGLVSNNIRAHNTSDNNQFKHLGTENSCSGTDHDHAHDQESSISDCESGISGPNNEELGFFGDGLMEVGEEDRLHEIIKRRFISGLGPLANHTSVVKIHRNSCSSFTGQARLQSFHVFARAVQNKCGGNANLKYAWYGTSRDEIRKIISHGFVHCRNVENNGLYGHGIILSPDASSIDSVKSSIVDKDGLRHVLLCRVIMGKTELVYPGSEQCHPSSEEFDSGVDNLITPKRYIVWSTHMNTYILPEYVISFRAPCSIGMERIEVPPRKPTSPWMPLSTLVDVLSKFLPPHASILITKYHTDHRENKISRHELVRLVRELVGDKLLTAVIKCYRAKQLKAATEISRTNSSTTSHRRSGRNSKGRRSG
ncbi:hypothetical protein U1Q18_007277 [Sarracenia purpurea var. burkii]